MRDLMFAMMMLMALPLAIARPFNAFLFCAWTAVMVPTSYFYGFMVDARLNFLFAFLTLLLIALGRVPWKSYQANRVTWLYLVFLLHATLVYFFAYPGNRFNAEYYEFFIKGLLFSLAMPFFVRERVHMHAFILVIVLGFGLHGVLNGLKVLASAGGHNVEGPAGTMIFDRNHLSTALALTLPLLYYLYQQSRHRLIQLGFLGGFVLVALAIVGSGSRGGFIAFAVVSGWLVLTSRKRWSALALLAFMALLFVNLAPEEWFSRLSTIETAGVDESFMGRVIAWQISSAIALNNPIFGGGFHAVQVQGIWDQFKSAPSLLGFLNLPVPEFSAKAAHSIYFEILGDMGFVGLFIFLGILFYAIRTRYVIKRQLRTMGKQWLWARDMADMLMLGIIAYMAGGAAVSLAYFEVIYMLVMLMEMLRLHVARGVGAEALQRTKGAPA
ncbi:putative O-glycosylation ligase, exosortase A system-associated [Hydrogenophaga sp.]|uniref:putative O-glycosylation ligase, exosortase A system-associated n=1 Tax=Hydrogenophaga sp. TaxID=1904254 RepID=UPI002731E645|nr:putative O-glycosylation ligase, exosortase A system-associated [Hydrogenophaga sp.]MDP2073789.1 putative O-glycosylation ligase, exosortase A system-associated [Hydrogenophaga sp.]MDP3106913.1 putative O-glycosylation ligase, exosortase A system-associated [Hydrogenophaga sp.]MDZ4397933.1 putative O-glycosylation ligase, exosortase A system-associated [Hydrogenophaga sp.]